MTSVHRIVGDSPVLSAVKALWRAHSDTLGFFPEGAFADYAARGQIAVALDDRQHCLGYLLHRVASDRAIIVHLCVSPESRGTGVARLLVDDLSSATRHLRGIGLRCRRDYDASSFWPRLGFVAVHEQPGRGHVPAQLTFWWLDHGHPTLFSPRTASMGPSLRVALDANVFFDLVDSERAHAPESRALEADWLSNLMELCVTAELYNEIERNPDTRTRSWNRHQLERFTILHASVANFERLHGEIRSVFPEKLNLRSEADLRQLAHAVAEDAGFFVTRDDYLLSFEDEIYQRC